MLLFLGLRLGANSEEKLPIGPAISPSPLPLALFSLNYILDIPGIDAAAQPFSVAVYLERID
jgi:hypothetical protein